jgi:hypothetical protein
MMKRRNTFLLSFAVVILLGFGVLAMPSFVRQFLHAPATQAEAEADLNEIAAPSSATVMRHSVINKWTHGTVGNWYRSELTYEQIRAYYDLELAQHGWTFHKQVPLTSWGKDMGESQTFYCKGARSIDIYFTGREESRLGYRYSLVISWGLYDCP